MWKIRTIRRLHRIKDYIKLGISYDMFVKHGSVLLHRLTSKWDVSRGSALPHCLTWETADNASIRIFATRRQSVRKARQGNREMVGCKE